MTSRAGARLSAVLVPLMLLSPVAAHAETVVTEDREGDAEAIAVHAESVDFVPAPAETSTDITRTVVSHGGRRLDVTVHFRDLVLTGEATTYVRVTTPADRYGVTVEKSPGRRARVSLEAGRVEPAECRGLRARVDGGQDTVAVSVPTACIGTPTWVRIGVGATRVDVSPTEDGTGTVISSFADDGHRGAIRVNSIGKGPKVRRG
ncbi:hypothetical protein [Nocardioides sp. SYSU D00065]|uniref:hypothetical protein n=1 Tax=Nocardioides sp. SYSU D00065 TaxID=2817378 RepID=UPI001B330C96|nr:hypothetical protein [Nocardioides sp. SYSU D00065]